MEPRRALAAGAWLGAAALALGAANARAATPIDPDLLTVSGRAALPSGAATPLAGRLDVGAVTLDGGAADAVFLKPDALQAALPLAAAKSLKNYGYRRVDAPGPASVADAAPLTVAIEVEPFEVTPDDKGEKVTARLRFTAGPGSACFPYEATGEFHALTALKTGGGQKTLAIFLVIASAAAGYAAPALLADQWRSADEQQAAVNAKRIVGKAEGVAPPGGPDVVARYGAINALQLALASAIGHLGDPGGCNAASAPPVVVAQTPPAPAAATAAAPPAGPADPATSDSSKP